MKKIFHGVTIAIVVFGALFLINVYWGNPLSRMNAQSETVQYYAAAYKQEFKVYDSEYNPLIPAYIFELGPVNNSNIRFDTGLFCQGITDVYGGILSAKKLSQDIDEILQDEYDSLNYEISAAEDPLASYAGETADYFETNPNVRVLKNHYNLVIDISDGALTQSELATVSPIIVKKIKTMLPYQTPNLRIYFKYKSDQIEESKKRSFFELFPTTT